MVEEGILGIESREINPKIAAGMERIHKRQKDDENPKDNTELNLQENMETSYLLVREQQLQRSGKK